MVAMMLMRCRYWDYRHVVHGSISRFPRIAVSIPANLAVIPKPQRDSQLRTFPAPALKFIRDMHLPQPFEPRAAGFGERAGFVLRQVAPR